MNRKEARLPTIRETDSVDVQQAVPLLLELPRLAAINGRDQELLDGLNHVTEGIQRRLGLALPKIHFHWHTKNNEKWFLNIFEVPVTDGVVNTNTSVESIVEQVHHALRHHLTLFVGIQETSVLLTQASVEYPDIVKETLRGIPMQNVAAILRSLIEEEVSIRNIRGILEALVAASQHEKDVQNLTEFARMALARQICHRYAPEQQLKAIAMTPQLEAMLLESLRASGGSRQLSLDPNVAEQLRSAMVDAVRQHPGAAIITHLQLRRQIRNFIAHTCFDTPVLSYNELMGNINIDIATRIDSPGQEHAAGRNAPGPDAVATDRESA